MSDQTAAILVQYWMEKSYEAFESATVLIEHHQYAACINRLYYAAFYAFGAALAQRGLSYGSTLQCGPVCTETLSRRVCCHLIPG